MSNCFALTIAKNNKILVLRTKTNIRLVSSIMCWMSYNFLFFLLQLIQTISAVDTDEPLVGHKFVFSISASNPNFTIDDREGKTTLLFLCTKYYAHTVCHLITSFLYNNEQQAYQYCLSKHPDSVLNELSHHFQASLIWLFTQIIRPIS